MKLANKSLVTRAKLILRESGPAPDSPRYVRMLSGGGLASILAARYLRVRVTPDALDRIRSLDLPLNERAELFRQAISLICVGETYKTTGLGRTKLADAAILALCAERREDASLLDIGVSDCSASLELLERMRPARTHLTDLHPLLYARGMGFFRVYLDGQKRLLGVKMAGFYLFLGGIWKLSTKGFTPIETINPVAAERFGIHTILPFDILSDKLDQPVSAIKCSNILNKSYFSQNRIMEAVANLSRSLAENGIIVISQNSPSYPGGEAWYALRKSGRTLKLAGGAGGHETHALFQNGISCP